jgi:hypothetical protein
VPPADSPGSPGGNTNPAVPSSIKYTAAGLGILALLAAAVIHLRRLRALKEYADTSDRKKAAERYYGYLLRVLAFLGIESENSPPLKFAEYACERTQLIRRQEIMAVAETALRAAYRNTDPTDEELLFMSGTVKDFAARVYREQGSLKRFAMKYIFNAI